MLFEIIFKTDFRDQEHGEVCVYENTVVPGTLLSQCCKLLHQIQHLLVVFSYRVLTEGESLLSRCDCYLEPDEPDACVEDKFSRCPLSNGNVEPAASMAFETCIDHRMEGSPEENNLRPKLREEFDGLPPCAFNGVMVNGVKYII